MTRRMTTTEALSYLELAFNVGPDTVGTGIVEAIIAGYEPMDAAFALQAYCQGEIGEIDPDSVQLHADRTDDGDMPAVHIIIKTEAV